MWLKRSLHKLKATEEARGVINQIVCCSKCRIFRILLMPLLTRTRACIGLRAFMTSVRTWLGHPYPLGATWMGNGVNFALFSEHAATVDLCLFDRPDASQEIVRIPITESSDHVWHVFLPEARPGQLYGYRISGPYDPEHGMRFNNAKLLIDPVRQSNHRKRPLGRRNVCLRRRERKGGFGGRFTR